MQARIAGQARCRGVECDAVLMIAPAELQGGVAPFCEQLAKGLGEAVALTRVKRGMCAPERSLRALATRSELPCSLLQYVGYGYERRGCPVGLVRWISRARTTGQIERLVTVFHEVFASGPPWRSSFWLSPVQRWLARRLARASDACVTSNELFGSILRRWVAPERVVVLPVFSTLGEADLIPGWEERERRLVVFGSPGVRQRAYRQGADDLARSVRMLEIREVVDLGSQPVAPREIAGVQVTTTGYLDAQDAQRWLLSSQFGYVAYPPALLGKSSVFSAYGAHGLCPVVSWPAPWSACAEGEGEYWLCAGKPPVSRVEGPATIADRARARYSTHSLARHVEVHRKLLSSCAS